MGEVSARNMVDSIERSKGLGLRRALIGLAIPMASDGTAKRLCLAGYERIEDVMDATVEELVAIRDIGPKVAESVAAFFARAGGRARRSRELRAPRRRPRRARRGPPGRRRRGGRLAAEGRDGRRHRRVHARRDRARRSAAPTSRAWSSRPAPPPRRRSARTPTTCWPAPTSARRRPTRRRSSASRSSTRTSCGRWLRAGRRSLTPAGRRAARSGCRTAVECPSPLCEREAVPTARDDHATTQTLRIDRPDA